MPLTAPEHGAPQPRPAAAVEDIATYPLADLSVGADAAPVLSLAQNESCRPPSPAAQAAAAATLAHVADYPDPDWSHLRAAIADVHGVDPGLLLCAAGSMELLSATARAYLGPGDRALMPAYGYLFFETAARLAGASVDRAPERAFTVDPAALIAALRRETRVVFLANPGNPTGTRLPPAAVADLRAGLPADVLLVVDEAYGEFSPDPPAFELVAGGATVVLRSFSKAYGLAGMRAGWGLFPPAVAAEVRKVLLPNGVAAPSQAAAAAALRDQAWMRATVAETAARRDRFAARMRAAGLTVPESHANFVLLSFGTAARADTAEAALRADGIVLRGMGGYGLPDCLRATIGSDAAMERAARAIESALRGSPP